jgi:hypothetical protein
MSQMSACETENSIVASDMQTFLEQIRDFVLVLAYFDAQEKAVENDAQTTESGEAGSKANLIMQQHSPKLDAVTADETPGQTADVFDSPGGQLSSSPKPIPESAYERKGTCRRMSLNIRAQRAACPRRETREVYISVDILRRDLKWPKATLKKVTCNGRSQKRAKWELMGVRDRVPRQRPHHRP